MFTFCCFLTIWLFMFWGMWESNKDCHCIRDIEIPQEYENQCVLKVHALSPEPGDREAGKKFFEEYVNPYYKLVVAQQGVLIIDLDGAVGYAWGWLETAIGQLGHVYGYEQVMEHIVVVCHDEPRLVHDIDSMIKEASNGNS